MSSNIILQIDNPFAFYALKSDSDFIKKINKAKGIEVYIQNTLLNDVDVETKKEILESSFDSSIIGKIVYKDGLINSFMDEYEYYVEDVFASRFQNQNNIKYFNVKPILEYFYNNTIKYSTMKILANKRLSICKEIKSFLKEHRYTHSVSVADTAYEIAKHNGFDESYCMKCYFAGLFHDVSKDLSNSLQYEYGKLYAIDKIDKIKDFAYHQLASCYLARKYFNFNDEEILNAISNHCTGNSYMDPMSMILYSADKVEPLREFKTDKLREICFSNYEVGFKEVLQDQVNYFIRNNIPYKDNIFTEEMYKTYLNK